ncbi:MAG: hypothetical protein AB7G23_19345 [Vicinamibacterales bacterium]
MSTARDRLARLRARLTRERGKMLAIPVDVDLLEFLLNRSDFLDATLDEISHLLPSPPSLPSAPAPKGAA